MRCTHQKVWILIASLAQIQVEYDLDIIPQLKWLLFCLTAIIIIINSSHIHTHTLV